MGCSWHKILFLDQINSAEEFFLKPPSKGDLIFLWNEYNFCILSSINKLAPQKTPSYRNYYTEAININKKRKFTRHFNLILKITIYKLLFMAKRHDLELQLFILIFFLFEKRIPARLAIEIFFPDIFQNELLFSLK